MRLTRISIFLPAWMVALLIAGNMSCGGGGGGGGGTPPAPAPVITSFNLTPPAITVGQTSQLTAVFSNGTGRVDPGGLALTTGVPTGVAPVATTTYTLTVTGSSGASVTQSQTLTVYPPLAVSAFTASPAIITAGGSSQLTASFSGGTGKITPGELPVISDTPLAVNPTSTTTYTLTVTPPSGAPATRTATVTVVPAATITAFTVDPASVREGNGSQLAFTFSGGTGVITPGNLSVVSGGTRAISPATTTTYTLTVTNAIGTPVTAQATVTVIPRPVLTSTAPAQIGSGQPLTFEVHGTDEFGAALGPYVLDYGPYGMAVTPTGTVTWNSRLPMFDKAMDVNWQVSIPSYPGVKLGGTIRLNDPARAMPLRRTGVEIPIWNSGLVVTDLDGDGRAEMLIASRFGLAIHGWANATYEQQWNYPYMVNGTTGIGAVASRDLNGDKHQEIFFGSGNTVVRLDGVTRREVARFTGAAGTMIRDIKVADVDRDGVLDVVCLEALGIYSSTAHVLVLDANSLVEKWRSPDLGLGASLAVGNVDADPALEIVTAAGYVYDGLSKANEWAYGAGFGRAVGTGDLDGDGVEEIVGMQDWTAFRGFSAVLKSPIWEKTGFDFDALLVTDSDGDGRAEIYVGDGQWGNVTGYRYEKATNTLIETFKLSAQAHGVTSLGIGDVDGDGQREIIWGSGETSGGADLLVVASLAYPGVEWMNAAPKQLDGPFLGGQLARVAPGDSRPMFVVPSTDSTYSGTRLLTLNPATGAMAVSKQLGSNWSRTATLALADFTGSGIDRALLTTAEINDGYFTAFDFAAGTASWTSGSNLGSAVATLAADLSGDGHPDMVTITSQGYVYVHDVALGTLIWKSTGLGMGLDLGVADLDGDGVPEILALTPTRLVAFKKSATPGLYLEAGAYAITNARSLIVADTDGDGQVEVLLLTGSVYSGLSKITRLDRTLSLVGVTDLSFLVQTMHLENLGNGRRNLVGSIAAVGSDGPHLRAFDPRNGAEIWRSPFLWGTVPLHSLHYVDVNADGIKEISFGTTQGMYVTR